MNRPLRIAMFVGSFPVISETFILRQITGLQDLGHEVDIYADTRVPAETPLHPEVARCRLLERTTFMDMPAESAPWEMPVRPITGRTWIPGSETSRSNIARILSAAPIFVRCFLRAPRLSFEVLKTREYRYQAASLSSLYRMDKLSGLSRRYDVLHAHFGPVGNSFRFTRQWWHAPLVVSFHGYDFSTLPRKEGRNMYHKLFETADVFTVNSAYTRRQLEALGCPEQKLRLLPVGLDPDRFPFRERTLMPGEPLRILSVGRLVEIKGHEYVVRAMAKLRRQIPALHYDIVGEGPLRSRLESLVAELDLQNTVTLHGALAGAETKRLMNEAHLFVLASVNVQGDQEGQGLVLQEAQACGLPVVATRHGALPEGMVEGETGFLVPERDADGLAAQLQSLAEGAECWAALGHCGRSFVTGRYDIRRLNSYLVELYAQAIAAYLP